MIKIRNTFLTCTLVSLVALMVGCDAETGKSQAIAAKAAIAENLTQVERDAMLRMSQFKYPEELKISLWADETQTKNPAYFFFDSRGRMLMTEAARFTQGVDDIRGHENKTVDDISITSLDDRLAMYEKFSDERPMSYYRSGDDLIRLLEDTNGDGRADKSGVFSEGYNDVLDGIGAGVIERDGKVYYTNIPNLWMLEDEDDDGHAEKRTSLQSGFGLRIGFYGHDMHGLIWGPDGKLYWSIGDRGFNFVSKEGKHFYGPNLGGVFRADPDGSNIEYFYNGLRNPQELAFDEYGNLFTADNDGDGGDIERINYLVEGGDSGWHAGHQSIMSFTERLKLRSHVQTNSAKIPNAWMTQDMWKPRNDKQPEFILPGIVQIDGGPSGFVYNPSSSLGEKWQDSFFVVHYLGTPAKSYISTFKVEDSGATFKVEDADTFLSGFNAVDVDFGPDGRLYLSEYNYGGWQPENQGTVYVMENPELTNSEQVLTNKKILTSDFSKFDNATLTEYLHSNHLRVRQRAQFELAKRGDEAVTLFTELALDPKTPELTRLHGIWGLSQMAYNNPKADALLTTIASLIKDDNPQVRMQAVRSVGDHRFNQAAQQLVTALNDDNARVAMYAGIGLGRIGYAPAVDAVVNVIKKNNNDDLWLRHGMVMALFGIEKSAWQQLTGHQSAAVRLAALLALRKHKDPSIAGFLTDPDQSIVDEAITAINDLAMTEAYPALAAHLQHYIDAADLDWDMDAVEQFQQHRLINANYNMGDEAAAKRLLAYAAIAKLPQRIASEALAAIEVWNEVNPIDTTTGLPSSANKQRADIKAVIKQLLPAVMQQVQGQALVQIMRIAQANDMALSDRVLVAAVENSDNQSAIRIQALTSLQQRQYPKIASLLTKMANDADAELRATVVTLLVAVDPLAAMTLAKTFLAKDTAVDQQAALRTLLTLQSVSDDKQQQQLASLTLTQLQALLAGENNPATSLEILDLAKASNNTDVKRLLAEYDAKLAGADIVQQYATTLYGGNALRGKNLFSGGGASECMRCHIVNHTGGDVGPDLSNIGAVHSKEYLLQALVDPSAAIASGYGVISLTQQDGKVVSGLYMGEDEQAFQLKLNDGTLKAIDKSTLTNIQRPMSGMPPMNYLLTPYQIRDMLAYLESLELEHPAVEEVH
ncbi:HEAT repeat domain-containing protein [Alteromonadaceae bacterium BrNp21-10]|nr:HEAT repeat domain-containing protein [Alteromonadaceae bacterium BrNp21-10]